MKQVDWNRDFHSRTELYGATVVDPEKVILVEAKEEYVSTFSGQVTLLTLASLLVRTSPNIVFNIDGVEIVEPLPHAGEELGAHVLNEAYAVNPYGEFRNSSAEPPQHKFVVGPSGTGIKVHGDGWYGFSGYENSPIASTNEVNPIGPAFAAIHACSDLFVDQLENQSGGNLINCLVWKECRTVSTLPKIATPENLGEIWTVGTGSVGTAALYFLTLYHRNFLPYLFDHDIVEIHNIGRSPVFNHHHIKLPKVEVTEEYLKGVGVEQCVASAKAFHDSDAFKRRTPGKPDIIISAANELNIREQLENSYPPIQIYGTTGASWQASLLRHIPIVEACSCCRFPPKKFTPQGCAVGQIEVTGSEKQVDASLPFLSYAAGLMTASEILKLNLEGYPFTQNQVVYNSRHKPHFFHLDIPVAPDCTCRTRDRKLSKYINRESKYYSLSHTN